MPEREVTEESATSPETQTHRPCLGDECYLRPPVLSGAQEASVCWDFITPQVHLTLNPHAESQSGTMT